MLPPGQVALRLLARGGFAAAWRRKFHSGAPGFGQANGDGLFRGPCSMLAFSNVVHFFPDKFPSLGGGRFSLAFVLFRSFDSFSLWHNCLLSVPQ
jgi:hypothetical protein